MTVFLKTHTLSLEVDNYISGTHYTRNTHKFYEVAVWITLVVIRCTKKMLIVVVFSADNLPKLL